MDEKNIPVLIEAMLFAAKTLVQLGKMDEAEVLLIEEVAPFLAQIASDNLSEEYNRLVEYKTVIEALILVSGRDQSKRAHKALS